MRDVGFNWQQLERQLHDRGMKRATLPTVRVKGFKSSQSEK